MRSSTRSSVYGAWSFRFWDNFSLICLGSFIPCTPSLVRVCVRARSVGGCIGPDRFRDNRQDRQTQSRAPAGGCLGPALGPSHSFGRAEARRGREAGVLGRRANLKMVGQVPKPVWRAMEPQREFISFRNLGGAWC